MNHKLGVAPEDAGPGVRTVPSKNRAYNPLDHERR